MIKHKVGNSKCSGKPCRVERCTVMLLVGMKAVSIGCKAKGFAQKPVGTNDPLPVGLIVRFVAQAYKRFTARKGYLKAKLLFLRRTNVKSIEFPTSHGECIAVGKHMKKNAVAKKRMEFCGKHISAHPLKDSNNLGITINIECTLIPPLTHSLHHGSRHPHSAKHMVRMGMSQEKMMNGRHWTIGLFKLRKYLVSSTSIDHQQSVRRAKQEASIVAACGKGIARTEHSELYHVVRVLQ